MANINAIKEHMEVIGADGAHVGTVDAVEGDRIKLTKADGGQGRHRGHHHYLSTGLVAAVEGNKVRLSATGANAFMFQEEARDAGSLDLLSTSSNAPQTQRRIGSVRSPSGRQDRSARTNWRPIGLGAAGVGAVLVAAMLGRRRMKADREFELRLQTDENLRLISSSKVEGTPVVGLDGERLGKIENFMVDKYSGRVGYAVMSFGGMMGFGESLFPLPWSFLTYDVGRDGYVLGISKEELADAPRFKPAETPEFDTRYRRSLAAHYRR